MGPNNIKLATTTIRLHEIFPIGLHSRAHFPSLETEDGRFGDVARRGFIAASARCRGAVGGTSGSAKDGEEILLIAWALLVMMNYDVFLR
jgi:hypothetical protein